MCVCNQVAYSHDLTTHNRLKRGTTLPGAYCQVSPQHTHTHPCLLTSNAQVRTDVHGKFYGNQLTLKDIRDNHVAPPPFSMPLYDVLQKTINVIAGPPTHSFVPPSISHTLSTDAQKISDPHTLNSQHSHHHHHFYLLNDCCRA